MLPLKVALCCLEAGEHLSHLEASLHTALAPESQLLVLPQPRCASVSSPPAGCSDRS